MTRGDGTGPPSGSGPRIGRGFGGGGTGQGRMQIIRPGAATVGTCICPSCGAAQSRQRGIPCLNINCPKCGIKMVRG